MESYLPEILFLDTCVVYPTQTRDIFMGLALRGMVRLKWSSQVHEEWMRALLNIRTDLSLDRVQTIPQKMLEALSHQEPLVVDCEHLVTKVRLPKKSAPYCARFFASFRKSWPWRVRQTPRKFP